MAQALPFPDDPVSQTAFLDALKRTGIIASACRASGVSYTQVHQLRSKNDDFAAAWDEAIEQATDSLETEARRRALEGYQEPVIYQGAMTPVWEYDADGQMVMEAFETGITDKDNKPVLSHRPKQLVIDGVPQYLTIRKHSDALLMFLLKGNRQKFKDSSKLELSNPDGTLTPIDDTTKAARLATLLALAEARSKADNFDDMA